MQSATMQAAGQPLNADETDSLISSEKVDGTTVYNSTGENIGSVHHLMIDKFSGRVDYAVMSFGGFLGIGESYHPLPWRSLTYMPSLGGYQVGFDRARLERAPRYTLSSQPNWADRSYRTRIDEYWVPSL